MRLRLRVGMEKRKNRWRRGREWCIRECFEDGGKEMRVVIGGFEIEERLRESG